MCNITFNNNKVFKIYDSEVNNNMLTLRFSPEDYELIEIQAFFEQKNIKDILKEIIKTTKEQVYVATFKNYTGIKTKAALVTYDIPYEEEKEVASINAEGEETTVTVPTTETKKVELITTILEYENPTDVLVAKLDNQINPTIDVETCTLDELKEWKVNETKTELAKYIAENPLVSDCHGEKEGTYTITIEKQNLFTSKFTAHMALKNASVDDKMTWNEAGKPCEEWTDEECIAFIKEWNEVTTALVKYQQDLEVNIMACEDKDAVNEIVIDFSSADIRNAVEK